MKFSNFLIFEIFVLSICANFLIFEIFLLSNFRKFLYFRTPFEEADGGCTQPCDVIRPMCGHICGSACHPEIKCEPFDPCTTVMIIKCNCNRRKQKVSCEKFQQMISHQKRAQQKAGQTGEIKLTLDCDAECDIQGKVCRKKLHFSTGGARIF